MDDKELKFKRELLDTYAVLCFFAMFMTFIIIFVTVPMYLYRTTDYKAKEQTQILSNVAYEENDH